MIFTRVRIKNLYCFEDTELDLTYPRKIADSTIEHEYLDDRAPNFRFKRLCIISGANASGKSSFGKIMMEIINIISKGREWAEKQSYPLTDESKPGIIEAEFIYPSEEKLKFRSLILEIKSGVFSFKYAECLIAKADSVENCRKKIDAIHDRRDSWGSQIYLDNLTGENYHAKWSVLESLLSVERRSDCWAFLISDVNNSSDESYIYEEHQDYKELLFKVLKTFDPSIIKITATTGETVDGKKSINGFTIHFANGKSCDMSTSGKLDPLQSHLVSQGTYQGIYVAGFIFFLLGLMKQHERTSATFFLDEKMSNSHTELEREVVNLLAQKTNRYSQIFYTTHNYDILEMSFPLHSFVFLKRERGGNPEFIWADKACNKNDRNILSYVKNNFFRTIPDISLLDDILWEE